MKNRFYFIIICCVALGAFFTFTGMYFSAWMASADPVHQERLRSFYQQDIFTPLSIPAQPVPTLIFNYTLSSGYFRPGHGGYGLLGAFILVPVFAQIVLLLRRIAICARSTSVQPPSSLNRGWKIVLKISLISWIVGVAITLLPRLIAPFLGSTLAYGVAMASGLAGITIVPLFWLISGNLFGLSFFVIELLSFRKEGLLPPPNRPLEETR